MPHHDLHRQLLLLLLHDASDGHNSDADRDHETRWFADWEIDQNRFSAREPEREFFQPQLKLLVHITMTVAPSLR